MPGGELGSLQALCCKPRGRKTTVCMNGRPVSRPSYCLEVTKYYHISFLFYCTEYPHEVDKVDVILILYMKRMWVHPDNGMLLNLRKKLAILGPEKTQRKLRCILLPSERS